MPSLGMSAKPHEAGRSKCPLTTIVDIIQIPPAKEVSSWPQMPPLWASDYLVYFGVMGREQLRFPTASVAQTWYWALGPCGLSTVARHRYSPYQRIGIS